MIRIITAIIGVGSLVFALDPPELIFTLIMFSIAMVMPLLPVLIFGIYGPAYDAAAFIYMNF